MQDSVYQLAGDIELGPLADGYELLCQAVASDRYQVGDAKRVWGMATRAAVAAEGCPSGYVDAAGRFAYTWEHVQLRCRGAKVSEAREAWVKSMREVLPAIGLNLEREQVQLTQRLAMVIPLT